RQRAADRDHVLGQPHPRHGRPRAGAAAAAAGGEDRQHPDPARFGRARRGHDPQREPRGHQQLRQRRPVPAGPDPGRAAQPDPRPAPDQRPPRRQPGALPAGTRRPQGVRTVTKPEAGKTGDSSAGGRESGSRTTGHRRTGGATRLAVGALLSLWLAGCSILGGGNVRERSTIYAPDPRVSIDPSAPVADWQLSLSPPVGARSIDSFRIAVRPTPDELQVYRGAAWAKTPTDMLQDALLRALEDSGKLPSIARQGAGIAADYKLVIDLRRFEADYAG